MPTTQITIDHINSNHGSRHSSLSATDDSHDTGVQISPPSASGSAVYTGSDRSETNDYVHLSYPDELQPEDSASRLPRHSHRHHHSRELDAHRHSTYRHESRPRAHRERELADYRPRLAHPLPPESVDSLDEFGGLYGPPRPGLPTHRQTYTYGLPQYAASASEPYASYPQVPSTQMIAHQPQHQPQAYGNYAQYPQVPHHPGHSGHPSYYQSPVGVGSSAATVPYQGHFSPPPSVPYGGPSAAYFPPYGMPPYGMPPYGGYPYPPRSETPPKKSKSVSPPPAPSPAPASAPEPAPAEEAIKLFKDTNEETIKMMKEMFEKQQQQIEERDKAKEAELKRIEDAKKAAEERAAADKKLQEEAAAAARAEGDKKLQEAEEKAKKELEEAKAEAEKAVAAAKEAAEKETAEKVAAAKAAPPAEKKAPIKFKDAIGRKYQFPWDMCCKWNNMEELIRQAFAHVDGLAQHVYEGHYDLAGPSGEIILKDCWEATVEPDWTITMHMWPVPEPEPEPVIQDDPIIMVEEKVKEKKPPKGKKGAKFPVVEKKRSAARGHEAIPVPPPHPSGPTGPMVFSVDPLFGELPTVDVPGSGSDVRHKKPGGAKRPQSGLFSTWMAGGRAGPSKGKKK